MAITSLTRGVRELHLMRLHVTKPPLILDDLLSKVERFMVAEEELAARKEGEA